MLLVGNRRSLWPQPRSGPVRALGDGRLPGYPARVVLPIRDDNPTSRRAIVTLALIAINLVVYFAIQPHTGSDAQNTFLYEHAAIPCEITTGDPVVAVPFAQPVTVSDTRCIVGATVAEPQTVFPHKNVYLAILFSMFLHGSVAHVLGNMLFLWIFGNNIEDRMGPFFFLLFYLFSGAVATFVFVGFNVHSAVPLVGASGAIAGVMGAYLVWFPRARVLSLVGFFPLYLPAVFVLGLWFFLQFLTNPNEGVAWQAHVGGFVVGIAVAWLTRPIFGPRRPAVPPSPYDDWDERGGFGGGYPGRL
jgi:rhomboid family protein